MQTIQIVIEDSLLTATDRAVKRLKLNRSALVREAIRQHLKRLSVREREKEDREGYRLRPQKPGELSSLDRVASWPDE